MGCIVARILHVIYVQPSKWTSMQFGRKDIRGQLSSYMEDKSSTSAKRRQWLDSMFCCGDAHFLGMRIHFLGVRSHFLRVRT